MKKDYIEPDFELLKFQITRDLLSGSGTPPEETPNELEVTPSDGDLDWG